MRIASALAAALLAATLVGTPAPAAAEGVTITVGGHARGHRSDFHGRRHFDGPRHFPRYGHVILAPRQCHYPGYWTYQWVPQSQVYYEWVPGHYNTSALWVEGHYAARTHASGYYQPIWVPDRWVSC
jgi:hypothetical protein